MKLSENRFFKPTVINLSLSPVKPSELDYSAVSSGENRDNGVITKSIVARSKTGSYDEVRTDSEMNNWSPFSFMQWFTKENKDSKLPGADNMEVMKYEDYENYENYEKLYSEKTDPASKLSDKKPERGSVHKRTYE